MMCICLSACIYKICFESKVAQWSILFDKFAACLFSFSATTKTQNIGTFVTSYSTPFVKYFS